MNTSKFDKIVTEMCSDFGSDFVERNPGCNENDVERAFLSIVGQALIDRGVFSQDIFEATYLRKIKEIR